MRSTCLGIALLLLALYGMASVGATTMPGPLGQAQLKSESSSGGVVLIKKKKKKFGKRHGFRKKARNHRAHRRPGRGHSHAAPRPRRQEFTVILRIDPDQATRSRSPLVPESPDRPRRSPLQGPPPPQLNDPDVAVPESALPDGTAPEITPRSEALSVDAAQITCKQAIGIVREFGFSEVEARRCAGETYQFAATRDGQAYAIELRAADGELTEVSRQ